MVSEQCEASEEALVSVISIARASVVKHYWSAWLKCMLCISVFLALYLGIHPAAGLLRDGPIILATLGIAGVVLGLTMTLSAHAMIRPFPRSLIVDDQCVSIHDAAHRISVPHERCSWRFGSVRQDSDLRGAIPLGSAVLVTLHRGLLDTRTACCGLSPKDASKWIAALDSKGIVRDNSRGDFHHLVRVCAIGAIAGASGGVLLYIVASQLAGPKPAFEALWYCMGAIAFALLGPCTVRIRWPCIPPSNGGRTWIVVILYAAAGGITIGRPGGPVTMAIAFIALLVALIQALVAGKERWLAASAVENRNLTHEMPSSHE